MDQGLTISDLLGILRRRAWILVVAIMIGAPLAFGIAYVLPPVYLATALILVESPPIPPDVAESTVTASAGEQLAMIEQRLMTRENLLEVIERLDLYADPPNMAPLGKVEKLRASTLIESQSADLDGRRRRGPANVATFTITVEADRGEEAAKIANEFGTLIVERNLQFRNTSATGTVDFARQEVEQVAGELLEIERQISAFKQKNEAALPESLEFRRTELSEIDVRMFEREQRKFELEELKRGLEQTLLTGEGIPVDRRLTEGERELQTLLQSFAELGVTYGETHPTMRRLAARIKALREANDAATDTNTDGSASLRKSEIAQEVSRIEAQLSHLANQRSQDEARKAALQLSIVGTPAVEMALSALDRRYSELKVQYELLVRAQARAETGERLEIGGQAGRFEIIENALVPEAPVSPDRTLIAAGGTFASIALGVGLILLAEMTSKAIRTPRDLERLLELRPVVTVPYIQAGAEIHSRRQSMAGAMLALLIIVPVGVYAIDSYYQPLPQLFESVLNSTGLSEVLRLIEGRF